MDPIRLQPSRSLLLVWIIEAGFCAVAVGKAVAGLCAVLDYSPDTAFPTAFAAAWILGILIALAYFFSLRYTLDKHHLTKAAGVLWRCRRSIPLDKVTNIAVRQGPIERLLRIGQVWIHTPSSGSDAPEERLIGMRNPNAVRDAIMQRAEAALPATAESALQEKREIVELLSEIRDRLARLERHLVPPDPAAPPVPPPEPETPAAQTGPGAPHATAAKH
jgi:putative membrane protein